MADLSGQSDVVVGVPMAGQATSGQVDLVGHSVNFLPFRTQVDLSRSYLDLVTDTRDYALEVNDHQRYTYASLVRHLTLKRYQDRHPLVSVSFNVDQGMDVFDFHGVGARYVVGPRTFVKDELFFNVVLEGDEVTLEVDHNSDILDRSTARGWMEAYLQLLEKAVRDPSRPLNDPA